MTRSTKRSIVLLTVLLVMATACGGDAADSERFCELNAEIEEQDEFFELAPDEARVAVGEVRNLIDEAANVAPDEVRPSIEVLAESYIEILDAFEAADFDHQRLDDAVFEDAFTEETNAAGDTLDAWVDANCSA